ncbi:MAG: acyl-CoA thioesterase [Leptospiraceae bacterium]|nr:acyl-CoA thioesterase [Leptospiraceae bacterium]
MEQFQHSLRVRYSEVDAQGIVFNANYLMYFDVAVTEYFRALGQPYTQFVERYGLDFHVSHAELDFKAPAKSDDEIIVHLRGEYSGATVHWHFQMQRSETLLCSGKINYVCVDTATGKVKRIPAEIGDLLRWQAL